MLDYLFYFSLIVIALLAYPPIGKRLYFLIAKVRVNFYTKVVSRSKLLQKFFGG